MTNKSRSGSRIRNTAKFAPSPVYPDLVALPLVSNERCYGPWLSSSITNLADSRIRYSNIGGKTEFVKEENLAPWNYGGFQLMNEAGMIQAQFSNSLQLFSERGGFVIPEAPTGIALAKALSDGGPLVTTIDVSITKDEVSTTVKMDLYSSSFGKLQKQKEGAIAQITRERQKIRDQNNAMARRNFGKNVSKGDFMAPLRQAGNALEQINKETDANLEYLKVTFDGDTRNISFSNSENTHRDGVDALEELANFVNSESVTLSDIWGAVDDEEVEDNGTE